MHPHNFHVFNLKPQKEVLNNSYLQLRKILNLYRCHSLNSSKLKVREVSNFEHALHFKRETETEEAIAVKYIMDL